jgi:hypothetical protein
MLDTFESNVEAVLYLADISLLESAVFFSPASCTIRVHAFPSVPALFPHSTWNKHGKNHDPIIATVLHCILQLAVFYYPRPLARPIPGSKTSCHL